MGKWSQNKIKKIWQPELAKYSKLDENGKVEFYYIFLDDIPEDIQVGLPQFIGHDGVIEIEEKIAFIYDRIEDWLKYRESNKDLKWLTKGRGKHSEIPLTEEELQSIRLGL